MSDLDVVLRSNSVLATMANRMANSVRHMLVRWKIWELMVRRMLRARYGMNDRTLVNRRLLDIDDDEEEDADALV